MPCFSSVREAHVGFVSEDTLFSLGPHKPFPGTISTLCTWTHPSCDGLYGEMGIQNLGAIFLKNEKTSDDRTFFTQWVRYHSLGVKRFHRESFSRGKETIRHTPFAIFSIFG